MEENEKSSVKEQAKEFIGKGIGWVKDHPKDAIIAILVVVIIYLI